MTTTKKNDPQNPSWTKDDFANAKLAKEALPPDFFKTIEKEKRKRGRPPVQNPKEHIGMRLDADIVAWLRSQKGYNALVNDTLRAAMKRYPE